MRYTSRRPADRAEPCSPRLSGIGLLVVPAACRSKAGLLCPGSVPCRKVTVRDGRGWRAVAGSVCDEVLDTEHAVVVRTYIEQGPRKARPAEKVLIIVVEPDEEMRSCRPRRRPEGTTTPPRSALAAT